jgi:hypothetical protein
LREVENAMPKKPAKVRGTVPPLFVVTFEYAQRSFKCVLLDWAAPRRRRARQWVVTIAGRAVWSFKAGRADTRDRVEAEVVRWWDSQS